MLGQPAAPPLSPCKSASVWATLVAVPIFSHLPERFLGEIEGCFIVHLMIPIVDWIATLIFLMRVLHTCCAWLWSGC